MPHLAFYAGADDIAPIVEYLLSNAGCTIYESHSVPDMELRRFTTSASILQAFGDGSRGLQLALHTPAMKGVPLIERFELNPNAALGKWRESISGWGLIQLLFGWMRDGELAPSDTNHNSEARARTWESTYPKLGPVAAWDFNEVTRISRLLNRHIKHLASSKGGPVVLPGAKAMVAAGQLKLRQNL
jgi:hypothetical protein